jgi:DNA-binding transcriptional MerR regulator
MEKIFAIGAAAEGMGRSVDTLREWDRRGLLRARRDSSGRRIYTAEDIERGLKLVKEMDEARVRGLRSGPAVAA